jgi:hypothetical protein
MRAITKAISKRLKYTQTVNPLIIKANGFLTPRFNLIARFGVCHALENIFLTAGIIHLHEINRKPPAENWKNSPNTNKLNRLC